MMKRFLFVASSTLQDAGTILAPQANHSGVYGKIEKVYNTTSGKVVIDSEVVCSGYHLEC